MRAAALVPRGNSRRMIVPACVLFLLTATAVNSVAQTFKTILTFNGTDGTAPYSSMVQGVDGNLYGTASNGGANNRGTVYKVSTTGSLTTIYSFCKQTNCTDGAVPQGGLVLGSDGFFYGTTVFGGTGTADCGSGCGTVFKIGAHGAITTLHNFCTVANCPDGATPSSALIQGTDGYFYGTTETGGANGQGEVFRITPAGKLTVIYSFCALTSCKDGESPRAALVLGTDGNLYGTTAQGGANGYGEVFRMTETGGLTILHSFDSTDGSAPEGALIQASDGSFYGETDGGGTSTACFGSGCGTVYRVKSKGGFTSLLSFNETDGGGPEYNALVQASDGNFYGAVAGGGTHSSGTIIKLTTGGSLSNVYNFCSQPNCDDGSGINSMIQDTNGIFYGTTAGGGSTSEGTLFSLNANLPRFAETIPSTGVGGSQVMILGNKLTGSLAVSFNGTSAAFTVVSSTEITATVPAAATTGTVTVTTPSGPLTSNAPFVVR